MFRREGDIMNYYDEIKNILVDNDIGRKVREYKSNQKDLESYYTVGKLLVEAQGGEERAKYGDGLIKEYSKRLTSELGKGYSTRNLKYMRNFYLLSKGQTLSALLRNINVTWSNVCEILKLKDINEIEYYLKLSNKLCLTTRELRVKIKFKEYERLPLETKEKLKNNEEITRNEKVPSPIVLENLKNNDGKLTEKAVQTWINENPMKFCDALGEGYIYAGSQYKIKIGSNYNYIDVLLFNYIFNSFIVVEIKVTELKKEYIGQIQTYMNYIDKNVKGIDDNKTVGIIICKQNNQYVIDYCSDDRIIAREYELV